MGKWLRDSLPIKAAMFEIAINEAVHNALEHGNPNLPVELVLTLYPNRVTARISGNGPGFCTIAALDKAKMNWDAEDDQKTSGRGIKIMLDACDRVVYNNTGNKVLLVKKFKTRAQS